jgi:hypothetical protein
MNGADYKLIRLIDRIYLNGLCCPMPPLWAELGNRISSGESFSNSGERYPPSLILGGWWESSDSEKRSRLLEQILFANRHGSINEACDYLMSLKDDEWHKMDG